MTTIINAAPQRQEAKADPGNQLIGCIFGIGLIVFGSWFGYNKTVEFLHSLTYDASAGIEAEMEMLDQLMQCLPGEVIQIVPLGDHGAKSAKCVPGSNMPPVRTEGESRG